MRVRRGLSRRTDPDISARRIERIVEVGQGRAWGLCNDHVAIGVAHLVALGSGAPLAADQHRNFGYAGFGGKFCSGSWAHLGPPVSANLIWYPGLVFLKAALFGVWLSRVLGRQSTTI